MVKPAHLVTEGQLVTFHWYWTNAVPIYDTASKIAGLQVLANTPGMSKSLWSFSILPWKYGTNWIIHS